MRVPEIIKPALPSLILQGPGHRQMYAIPAGQSVFIGNPDDRSITIPPRAFIVPLLHWEGTHIDITPRGGASGGYDFTSHQSDPSLMMVASDSLATCVLADEPPVIMGAKDDDYCSIRPATYFSRQIALHTGAMYTLASGDQNLLHILVTSFREDSPPLIKTNAFLDQQKSLEAEAGARRVWDRFLRENDNAVKAASVSMNFETSLATNREKLKHYFVDESGERTNNPIGSRNLNEFDRHATRQFLFNSHTGLFIATVTSCDVTRVPSGFCVVPVKTIDTGRVLVSRKDIISLPSAVYSMAQALFELVD